MDFLSSSLILKYFNSIKAGAYRVKVHLRLYIFAGTMQELPEVDIVLLSKRPDVRIACDFSCITRAVVCHVI